MLLLFLAEEFDWLFNCRFQIYNTGTIAGGKNDRREFIWRQIWNRPKITLQITSQTESSDLFLSLSSLRPQGEREGERKKRFAVRLDFSPCLNPGTPLAYRAPQAAARVKKQEAGRQDWVDFTQTLAPLLLGCTVSLSLGKNMSSIFKTTPPGQGRRHLQTSYLSKDNGQSRIGLSPGALGGEKHGQSYELLLNGMLSSRPFWSPHPFPHHTHTHTNTHLPLKMRGSSAKPSPQ